MCLIKSINYEIKKISLRTLNDEALKSNELTHIKGGVECGCGCHGPSSTSDNMSFNYAGGGLVSPGGCNYIGYDGEGMEAVVQPRIRMTRIIVVISILFLSLMHSGDILAQRKDTDAKIPTSNYVIASRENNRDRKKILDANIRIRYAFNALDLNDKSTWIDEGQLKVAPNMTDYSSRFVEVNEDSLACWFRTHGTKVAYPPARWIQGYKPDYWIEYQYSQITTQGNTLTEWATMPRNLASENLYYTESLPLFKWNIESDTKIICGYECIKATCHWRGRDYTAWFTPDIPIEAGPWKFGGLPGLIMRVADDQNVYSFEAVAVENGHFPIYAPRGSKYKQSTRDKVWRLQRALNENYLKATDHSFIHAKTGQVISSRKHTYSQLELE